MTWICHPGCRFERCPGDHSGRLHTGENAEDLLREWIAWAEVNGTPERAHALWQRSLDYFSRKQSK